MPNEIIYKEGEAVNEMHFIQEGVVELIRNQEGSETEIIGNGEHFGEMAVLTH